MKLIKMVLLAAIAAVAAMVLISASTALATPPWIAVCLKAELLNCKKESLAKHPLLGRLVLTQSKGFFIFSDKKIECPKAAGETNLVESQREEGFKFTLERLTFTECPGCMIVEFTAGQPMSIGMESAAGEDWYLQIEKATIKFTGCFGMGVNCKFEGNLKLKIQMDESGSYFEPEPKEKGVEFKRTEGLALFCKETLKWTEGKTTLKWLLDDEKDTVHNIWPSLIGKELIKT